MGKIPQKLSFSSIVAREHRKGCTKVAAYGHRVVLVCTGQAEPGKALKAISGGTVDDLDRMLRILKAAGSHTLDWNILELAACFPRPKGLNIAFWTNS